MSGKTYSQCIARVVQGGLTSVANTVGVFFYSLPKMLYETSTGAMNKAYKKVYDSTLLKLARRETTIEEELAKRDPTKSYLDSIISPEKRKKIKEALTWWTVFKDSEDLSSDVLKFLSGIIK